MCLSFFVFSPLRNLQSDKHFNHIVRKSVLWFGEPREEKPSENVPTCPHFLRRIPVAFSVLVALHVQGQVVRAREAAAAGHALEGFGASVFAVVSGQLVGAGEAPVAVVPRAAVRFLA